MCTHVFLKRVLFSTFLLTIFHDASWNLWSKVQVGLDKKDAQVAELYEERNGLATQVLTLTSEQERLIEVVEVMKNKTLQAANESNTDNEMLETFKKQNTALEKQTDSLNETVKELEKRLEEEGKLTAISTAALKDDLNSKLEEIKGSDTQLREAINEVDKLRQELVAMSTELKGKSDESEQLINVDEDDEDDTIKSSIMTPSASASASATSSTRGASDSQILVLCNDIKTMKDQLQRTAGKFITKIRSQKAQVFFYFERTYVYLVICVLEEIQWYC